MRRLALFRAGLPAALIVALLAAPQVRAELIGAGSGGFTTVSGPNSYYDFGAVPIAAGFFGPGSDPFTGRVMLQGLPFSPLSPTDTVISVPKSFELPLGKATTFDVEMTALSLRSVSPIEVTFNGGASSSFFDVFVTLDPKGGPATGSASVIKTAGKDGKLFHSFFEAQTLTGFLPVDGSQGVGLLTPELLNQKQSVTFSAETWVKNTLIYGNEIGGLNVELALSGPHQVPEPGTLALLGIGAAGLVALRRWRQR